MQSRNILDVTVLWRGNKYTVEVNANSTFGELGEELQKLTEVQADTLRLIVPQFSSKSSKMISPFSDEHKSLILKETSFFKAMRMPIRMMGVSKDEVSEVLHNANKNYRIAGFEDEENRLIQRMSYGPQASLRLPQGPYIFCEFRTLQIPGVELNPPASEALKRMHSLAADPGIVAIMRKHHWRVGIMTEMAPVGYVGVSPECILGFNKNHGEEISLRLRTDDLKGFRKYESIKKTLLHELAHMVHSGHDANFYALNKQLNEEASNLDWTRSGSHTLIGVGHLQHQDQDIEVRHGVNFSQKLGGSSTDQLSSARASSVSAAFRRLVDTSSLSSKEPQLNGDGEPNLLMERNIHDQEPDPDDNSERHDKGEPDPDNSHGSNTSDGESYPGFNETTIVQANVGVNEDGHLVSQQRKIIDEPDPDDLEVSQNILVDGVNAPRGKADSHVSEITNKEYSPYTYIKGTDSQDNRMALDEPDPDDALVQPMEPSEMQNIEPDPDDLEVSQNILVDGVNAPRGKADSHVSEITNKEYSPYTYIKGTDSQDNRMALDEPDPDDALVQPMEPSEMQNIEPDPDDQEIQRIQDPVVVACKRLRRAVELLNAEVNPGEASTVLQTLFKIVRNAIEHPNEIKYRKLRKANPIIQRNVASHKAAMEILMVIGFVEDVMFDGIGNPETFLVLKRDDPGLLWLAKTSLEAASIAH